ncbi:Hsp20/alpha crystallin family protein [Natronorubrum tibetense]|uniref:Heat shock protein Hsp20 n=1 Tax=Natronorubrum tibetense GA33 TaxID=1114856 RepID=L9VFB0_9EURY|nr:Hsp20/alpha crystallin family protein [Natronorubrum tibetense]ELY35746.1 heat shock protein Hsp20 [Natronorubrum tibetense GA33]
MRKNPFEDIEEMLDRVSKQVESGMTSGGLQVPGSVPADVVDTGEEYLVTADLPGYETDDIELTLSEGTLRLEASREDEEASADGRYLRRERTRTSANRRIRLPEPVEEEEVSAGYENGVLTVRLPKITGGETSKEIDIE